MDKIENNYDVCWNCKKFLPKLEMIPNRKYVYYTVTDDFTSAICKECSKSPSTTSYDKDIIRMKLEAL